MAWCSWKGTTAPRQSSAARSGWKPPRNSRMRDAPSSIPIPHAKGHVSTAASASTHASTPPPVRPCRPCTSRSLPPRACAKSRTKTLPRIRMGVRLRRGGHVAVSLWVRTRRHSVQLREDRTLPARWVAPRFARSLGGPSAVHEPLRRERHGGEHRRVDRSRVGGCPRSARVCFARWVVDARAQPLPGCHHGPRRTLPRSSNRVSLLRLAALTSRMARPPGLDAARQVESAYAGSPCRSRRTSFSVPPPRSWRRRQTLVEPARSSAPSRPLARRLPILSHPLQVRVGRSLVPERWRMSRATTALTLVKCA